MAHTGKTLKQLAQAHNILQSKITNLEQGKKDAQVLQTFLYNLKTLDRDSSSFKVQNEAYNEKVIDLTKASAVAFQSELKNNFFNGNKQLQDLGALFNRNKKMKALEDYGVKNKGEVFEYEITKVFNTVIQQVEKSSSSSGNKAIKIGREQAKVILSDKPEKEVEDQCLKNAQDHVNQTVKDIQSMKIKNANSNLYEVTKISNEKRQGKVDVLVESDFKIKSGRTTDTFEKTLREVAKIIRGKKFTLKSYSSFNEAQRKNNNGETLRLGHTDPYKAISGAALALGIKDTNFFANAYRCYSLHEDQTEDIANHIIHLRTYYELVGSGLTYFNEGTDRISLNRQQSSVDFLIYNVPDSNEIYVRSTADLISTMFNDTSSVFQSDIRNPFGHQEIAITKEKVRAGRFLHSK